MELPDDQSFLSTISWIMDAREGLL
jgi:hypothetical protein